MTLTECTRQSTCYDCKNEKCHHHGDKGADCPKYRCDNAELLDCDHCDFIDRYIKDMRMEYGKE